MILDTRQWEIFILLYWTIAWSVMPNPPLEPTTSIRVKSTFWFSGSAAWR
jgi:hypothetical protein